MQIDQRKILIVIAFVSLLMLPLVNWTTGNIRIAISFIVLLLAPGYTLLAALFPQRRTLRTAEHFALSMGLSLAIVPVLGLIVHFSPWGLTINSVLIALIVFILITAGIAWYRSAKLAAEERAVFRILTRIPAWSQFGKVEKLLSITLLCVLIILAGVITYAFVSPNRGENYTEFYILDAQGTTQHYPEKIVLGDPVTVTVVVVSHEDISTDYNIQINVNGVLCGTQETGSLVEGQKWQQEISFVPPVVGDAQKVEYWLFKAGESQPYNQDSLFFNIKVSGGG